MFPVELSAYNMHWVGLFEQEQKLIFQAIGETALRIEHFGSTSIPGLVAKDTIDILVEIIDDETRQENIIENMKTIHYDFMWQTYGEPPYMVFVKGYNTTGVKEQTYHVHMGPKHHKLWDRFWFRDYLRENTDIARQYENLKLELAEIYKHDRVGYRIAKTEFVLKTTDVAKQYYSENKCYP